MLTVTDIQIYYYRILYFRFFRMYTHFSFKNIYRGHFYILIKYKYRYGNVFKNVLSNRKTSYAQRRYRGKKSKIGKAFR